MLSVNDCQEDKSDQQSHIDAGIAGADGDYLAAIVEGALRQLMANRKPKPLDNDEYKSQNPSGFRKDGLPSVAPIRTEATRP